MVQLQRPPFVFINGEITEWDHAKIHIGSEALIRGISVFEGMKGYWNHSGDTFSLLALKEHYERLVRSASLQHLPFSMKFDEFKESCRKLVHKLLTKERDLWLRPTLFAVEGHWGENTVTDLAITGYHQDKKRPESLSIGISTWQRPLDTSLPARIKSAANYQIGRLARIEGRQQGFDDMVLLNQNGRVAEATGSCIIMVSNNAIHTPPAYEGCLESITVNIIESLSRSLGILFYRRPIDRTELLVADEIALAGTLMEIGIVNRLGHHEMPYSTPVLEKIQNEFWKILRGHTTHDGVRLTPI